MVMILRLASFANPIITQVGSLDGGPYHYPHYNSKSPATVAAKDMISVRAANTILLVLDSSLDEIAGAQGQW
jgi:hypothetical protein